MFVGLGLSGLLGQVRFGHLGGRIKARWSLLTLSAHFLVFAIYVTPSRISVAANVRGCYDSNGLETVSLPLAFER